MHTKVSTCPPILFLVFNRPQTTAIVFEAIRAARPSKIYVAADGARSNKLGEADICERVRQIATGVDWPCEIKTLFRDKNLGCRRAVSSAITWFFEEEPEGIILEDDCVPHPDFFRWCTSMLELYRNEPSVMCITGNNFQPSMSDYQHSYYFSIYNHCWGWASWRRAWELYDSELAELDPRIAHSVVSRLSKVAGFARTWLRIFENVRCGRLDSWAYIWTWSCWLHGGLTCTPKVNLVSNIGFGNQATHTIAELPEISNLPTASLPPPYQGPMKISPETDFDDYVSREIFGVNNRTVLNRIMRRLYRASLVLTSLWSQR